MKIVSAVPAVFVSLLVAMVSLADDRPNFLWATIESWSVDLSCYATAGIDPPDGELLNETPKKTFDPFSRYGNLHTERKFGDGKLTIEFKVPPGGNSGIYVRGAYEAQVVDRDSERQGIHGVGAIFNRIEPTKMAGKAGGEWQSYEITIVDRHATVVLNGEKVIDNQPVIGNTNGAYQVDITRPGPLYLQGDHTAVSYRNIVFRPVVQGG